MAPPTGGAECINAKKCNVMSLEVEVHKEQSVSFSYKSHHNVNLFFLALLKANEQIKH